jgi:small subunit ribosomal protein S2
MLHRALQAVSDTVAKGGRVLFVGTKRQAQEIIAENAKRSAQYYVNSRWLGGTLTNWKTVSNSISRLRKIDDLLNNPAGVYTKKERLTMTREKDKLERALGGIKDMGGTPDIMFVIDTNKEAIAIQEARRLGIPVVAIIDTNCNPDGIDFPIPGNDDAGRAIQLYCDLIARSALDGIGRSQGRSGVDIGAMVDAPMEDVAAIVAAPAGVDRLTGPRGVPDDFSKLTGLTPAMATKFNDLGVFHYWQIAGFTGADVAEFAEKVGAKGKISSWVEQAKSLADA